MALSQPAPLEIYMPWRIFRLGRSRDIFSEIQISLVPDLNITIAPVKVTESLGIGKLCVPLWYA